MRYEMLASLLGCFFCLASCSDKGGGEVVELKENSTKTMSPGEVIQIELPGNPTTGFSWILRDEKELKCVKVASRKFVSKLHPKGMTGVPGVEEIAIEAVSPGEETLVFDYKRVWEKKPPVETKSFPISVSAAR